VEIVNAAEAAQSLDARSQRVQRQQVAEFGVNGAQSGDGFVDRADVGAMRLLERRKRPALRLEPLGMRFGPGLFGAGEAAAVAQQEVREAMASAEHIGADVFPTP
jgi:hypothetical protein